MTSQVIVTRSCVLTLALRIFNSHHITVDCDFQTFFKVSKHLVKLSLIQRSSDALVKNGCAGKPYNPNPLLGSMN